MVRDKTFSQSIYLFNMYFDGLSVLHTVQMYVMFSTCSNMHVNVLTHVSAHVHTHKTKSLKLKVKLGSKADYITGKKVGYEGTEIHD